MPAAPLASGGATAPGDARTPSASLRGVETAASCLELLTRLCESSTERSRLQRRPAFILLCMIALIATFMPPCIACPFNSGFDSFLSGTHHSFRIMHYCAAINAIRTPSHSGATMRLATESSALSAPAFPRTMLASRCSRQAKQPAQRLCRHAVVQTRTSDRLQARMRTSALSNQAGGYGNQQSVIQQAVVKVVGCYNVGSAPQSFVDVCACRDYKFNDELNELERSVQFVTHHATLLERAACPTAAALQGQAGVRGPCNTAWQLGWLRCGRQNPLGGQGVPTVVVGWSSASRTSA